MGQKRHCSGQSCYTILLQHASQPKVAVLRRWHFLCHQICLSLLPNSVLLSITHVKSIHPLYWPLYPNVLSHSLLQEHCVSPSLCPFSRCLLYPMLNVKLQMRWNVYLPSASLMPKAHCICGWKLGMLSDSFQWWLNSDTRVSDATGSPFPTTLHWIHDFMLEIALVLNWPH